MKSETEQRLLTGKDILPVEDVNISSHALSRFQMRTGLTFLESAEQIKKRLGDALPIERHKKVKINKKKNVQSYYLQDSFDSDLVYVIDKNERKNSYFMTTTLFPLRRRL